MALGWALNCLPGHIGGAGAKGAISAHGSAAFLRYFTANEERREGSPSTVSSLTEGTPSCESLQGLYGGRGGPLSGHSTIVLSQLIPSPFWINRDTI